METKRLPAAKTLASVATPNSVPRGDPGWERRGYWPWVAKVHIRGMISMSPVSSIFPYTDKCLVTDVKNKFMVESEIAQSCPTLCDLRDCSLPGTYVHGDFPDKNTGAGCHALLQGIFPTQGSNPGLPHCRQILYRLSL